MTPELPVAGPKRRSHRTWLFLSRVAAGIMALGAIWDIFIPFLPEPIRRWLPLISLVIATLAVGGETFARAVYGFLVLFSPLGVALTLGLTSFLVYQILPNRVPPVKIEFDPTRCGLFNSWYDPLPGVPTTAVKRIRRYSPVRRIQAYGISSGTEPQWVFDGESVRFTFEVNAYEIAQNDQAASSGGYMTFYDTPCRKSDYFHVAFDLRITGTDLGCKPDVGVRLAVDGQGRELATYELGSIAKYFDEKYNPDGNWKPFDIYIPDLPPKHSSSLPTPGISKDTLNKIVFFVNEEASRRCAKGTIWIKNVVLRP